MPLEDMEREWALAGTSWKGGMGNRHGLEPEAGVFAAPF